MARRTSVTIVLLAILAGAWVSQAAAQAEDPAVAELAAYKHKKHEKHGKYDKDTKYEHKYEKDTKYEHKYEKKTDSYEKYHDKPSYSGDKSYHEEKPYYGEEYSSGETGYSGYSGEYSSEGYSSGPSTGPVDSPKGPRFISFEVQLGNQVLTGRGRSLLQDAPRKLLDTPQASIQSDWSNNFVDS
jgi:Ni/Co efflux regulator RcnB